MRLAYAERQTVQIVKCHRNYAIAIPLLDEPTEGLDAATERALTDAIRG